MEVDNLRVVPYLAQGEPSSEDLDLPVVMIRESPGQKLDMVSIAVLGRKGGEAKWPWSCDHHSLTSGSAELALCKKVH